MADDNVLDKLKLILREKDCPFFEDEELLFYYNELFTPTFIES